ncbi:unnamed protein product [Rhizoctonia solani]|uniref:Aminoglycoside phosphotransferase domain-containing protein n=1 Tax=Rhizoctonia solani TaxID=456999 RepID=A0A8H3HQ82_9AGAM|nr:unnamed protein product [Rhizoctonia solani]
MIRGLDTNGPGSGANIGATQTPSDTPKRDICFPSDLPSGESIIFKDSSFFRRNGSTSVLPSPSDILAEAHRRGVVNEHNPPPIHYPLLGLTIKYGRTVSITEGQCLWALRRLPGNIVPAPEVYGWETEGGFSYIYMEHIPGVPLSDRWDSLSETDKRSICCQLRGIVARFRAIQPDGERFIGSVTRQALLDVAFTDSASPPVGPFPSVASFHDLFVKLPRPHKCDPNDPPHPFRGNLPDEVPIVFTHGDLHRSNVIISSPEEGGRPFVKSIIDWGQAGWYPSYWEYCKARWTADWTEEWVTIFIPLFLDSFDCYKYWDYFLLSMGV